MIDNRSSGLIGSLLQPTFGVSFLSFSSLSSLLVVLTLRGIQTASFPPCLNCLLSRHFFSSMAIALSYGDWLLAIHWRESEIVAAIHLNGDSPLYFALIV